MCIFFNVLLHFLFQEKVEALDQTESLIQETVVPSVESQPTAAKDTKTALPALKWKFAKDKLIAKRNTGQLKLQHMVRFVAGIEELQKWVNIMTVEVASLAPVATKAEEIELQLSETEV